MKRREFLSIAGATPAALAGGAGVAALDRAARGEENEPRKPVRMYVGCQQGPTTPEMLQYFKRHGVDHICGYPPEPGERGYWTVEGLEQTRDLCEKHGVTLDMVALPFLESSHIDREKRGAIMLGQGPERDRDIEHINLMTANCAKAGIPAWKYNMSLLGVVRTQRTPGRGGSSYSTWKLAEAQADPPLTRAGRVTADVAWERITYFLDRVIPVCNEYKVRAACHPHDPGMPPEGFQGIVRVLGTVEGLKKFVAIQESPYHGLNLCLGTTAEMLQDPAREIHDVIRYFGERNKIFNIHFRNIVGRRDNFQEVYVDNGDMDMLQVARTLHQVGYQYMLMPDHVPRHPDDRSGRQAFAFSYGYIKAILHAIATYG
ncbi:MAG: mannonate dehydratase [Planctomycetes bacterium]|nr:mannonate dehydratase [Planctomycetota bacterium]